jgi:YbbR domain-containing protein
MKHIGLKIIAFIFGVALWFYVVSARTTTIEMEVPVQFVRLPSDLAIASRPPASLPIKISGRAIDLLRLKAAGKKAATIIIDLHNAGLDTETFPITEENFSAPDYPKIKFASSDHYAAVEISFDTRITRTVPVKLKAQFEVAPNYTLIGTPKILPDTIHISGARSALMRVFEIPTGTQKFKNLSGDSKIEVPFDLSSLPPFVDVSDSMATVSLEIQPLARSSFEGIPVQLIGSYDRKAYSLIPATATVEVTGGKGALSRIRQSDIQLFIEYNRFQIEDKDSLEPTVRILQTVQSYQVHPEKFMLKHEAPDAADSAAEEN